MRRTALLCSCVILFVVPVATSQRSVVETKTITLSDSDLPVGKALAELTRLTSVTIRDEREDKSGTISLDLNRASFWRALDSIATAAKARVTSRPDGIVLVRRLPGERVPPVSYDGDFRLRVLRVTSSRDLDSDRSNCTFAVDVTWTPTLLPLFLDSQPHGLRMVDGKGTVVPVADEGGTLAPVDGRTNFAFDITTPGLLGQRNINLLEGKLNAVVPSKFLTFSFDADLAALKHAVMGGAVRRLVQEDVVCRVERVVLDGNRWSVRLGLEYPPGGKALESFQAGSLVVNNQLRLVTADGKRTLVPSSYVIDSVSSRRAQVTYHFTDRPGTAGDAASTWKVQYRAPARVVEVPVKFSFHDVPLP